MSEVRPARRHESRTLKVRTKIMRTKPPTGYTKIIIEATECSVEDAHEVEDIMRDVIYHSTLDWQTLQELTKSARLAAANAARVSQ